MSVVASQAPPQGADNPIRVIQQTISLKIDPANQMFEGFTELDLEVRRDEKKVHLHSQGLDVIGAAIDGLPAQFALEKSTPGPIVLETAEYNDIMRIPQLGQAVAKDYATVLEAAAKPRLEISLPMPLDDAAASSILDCKRRLKLRIVYRNTKPRIATNAGIAFWDGRYAVADTEVPATWLPCVSPDAATLFSLKLTVAAAHVAVGPGQLTKQLWADGQRVWRTFFYKVPVVCAPRDLGFATGPFEPVCLPTEGMGDVVVTHFVPPSNDRPPGCDLKATCRFFALPFALFEGPDALNARFPLRSMQQVFLPASLARREFFTAIGLQGMSADLLLIPSSVEQSQEARCTIARALARQWFGHYVRPASSDDIWLIHGLSAWLEEQYIRKYMGRTEAAYRRWRCRQLMIAGDASGEAPPLALRGVHLYGSEQWDATPLRDLKSFAVVAMLERRAGEDLFKRQVEALVASCGSVDAVQNHNHRLVDAATFVENLAKATDFRNEWPALLERWVYGRGVPFLTLGFRFHRRGCYLEVGIQQRGSRGSRAAALAAERVAAIAQASTGVIKVVVREGSGATADHPVHVGAEALVAAELRVNPEVKKVQRKRGRKRKDEEERAAELAAAVENMQHPVQWVRLDPGGEWLCGTRVLQPERTLCNQLRDSKDVVAQAEAVRGISELTVADYSLGPLNALKEALEDVHIACRVRCEAAAALAALRDDGGKPAGLKALLSYYFSRYWEGEDAVKPVTFASIDDYFVAQAVAEAVAQCARLTEGDEAFEAVALLSRGSDCYQSAWNAFDDSGMLAALLRGLGMLRLPADTEPALLQFYAEKAHDTLLRYLERELVAPSPWYVVGRSSLVGLADLLAGPGSLASHISHRTLEETMGLIELCALQDTVPFRLRDAAVRALSRLRGGRTGMSFAVWTLGTQHGNRLPHRLVQAAWEEAASLAHAHGTLEGHDAQEAEPTLKEALHCTRDPMMEPCLRHLVFMTLRQLVNLPPTLYVPPPSETSLLEEASAKVPETEDTPAAVLPLPGAPPPAPIRIKLSAAGVVGVAAPAASAELQQPSATGAPSFGQTLSEGVPGVASPPTASIKPAKIKLKLPSSADGGGGK